MSKKLISIRLDQDILKDLRAICDKIGKIRFADAVNAALYHFLSSTDKKRQKYIRGYMVRHFGGDMDMSDD